MDPLGTDGTKRVCVLGWVDGWIDDKQMNE